MSYLDDVKKTLRVIHNDDDDLLNRLIDSATREFLKFINSAIPPDLDSLEVLGDISADAYQGIILVVQADYDGDPDKRDIYRRAAEGLWMPYRLELGI